MQRVSVVPNKETRSKIKIVEHTRLQKKKKRKKNSMLMLRFSYSINRGK